MIYKLRFKLVSPLSNIPDSQSIFGAICHLYKIKYGEDKLVSFLENECENNVFYNSSMYYDNMLPKPFNMKTPPSNDYKLDDVKLFKKEKKAKYISIDLYLEYLKDKENFLNNFKNKLKNKEYVINSLNCICKSNDITNQFERKDEVRTRNDQTEHRLFYNFVSYYSCDLLFCFYIKGDETLNIIDVFKEIKDVSIGSNKSIGYNSFEYVDYQEMKELDNLNSHLLISKALCNNNINYDESYYSLSIQNNKFNSNASYVFRDRKICFLEGSIIYSNNTVGKIVKEKDNYGYNYQNLLGFMI